MGTFRSKSVALASVIVLVLQSLMPAIAQDRQLVKTNNSQKRVALVIGNAVYTKAKPLANPANDASDMAATLKGLGFEVVSGVNQNKRQIEALIRDFGTKLAASGGVGLFYYAGHGIQVGGENYLVPVDADIPEEDEVAYSAVPISLVLTKMSSAKNDLNIVILDACRNNPFARSWRGFRDSGNSDGLAKISPPTGTLVLYATEPGKVASDGTGRNGLFTESLLKQIKTPGLEYDQMVRALSTDVWERSGKQQLPWKEGNALQVFYFSGQGGLSKPSSDPVVTAKTEAQQEQQAWDLVKNSNDAGDLRLFLKEFPSGVNSAKANIRLEELVWQSAKAADTKEKVKVDWQFMLVVGIFLGALVSSLTDKSFKWEAVPPTWS
ncbi:MAG TPA: caspase family protein, partial [Pyrinomonadaceae bacterium]|nr:caspase family protein [Pyrinomonadaceae bacterium]